MEFNLRNNKYSTEFKNKPKFKPISHKLFSNEKLKKDSDFYQIWLAKERQKDSQLAILFATYKISLRIKIKNQRLVLDYNCSTSRDILGNSFMANKQYIFLKYIPKKL